MPPYTGPALNGLEHMTCLSCDQPLPAGRTLRCNACIAAAEQACREITTRPILPSDIAAIRARQG